MSPQICRRDPRLDVAAVYGAEIPAMGIEYSLGALHGLERYLPCRDHPARFRVVLCRDRGGAQLHAGHLDRGLLHPLRQIEERPHKMLPDAVC